MVLEVVVTDDNQSHSSNTEPPGNGVAVGELSVVPSSSGEMGAVIMDVASLTIDNTENNQALDVHSQGHASERTAQELVASNTSHRQLGTEINVDLHRLLLQVQQQTQQLQIQMEEVLGRTQHLDHQRQHTQQQMYEHIDRVPQTSQLADRQHTEGTQRIMQPTNIRRQQLEESLQTPQQQLPPRREVIQQDTQPLNQEVPNVQQADEHSRQQDEQLLQLTREIQKVSQQQDRLLPELRYHEIPQAFEQFMHAQYRVLVVLAKPSQELPIPRLFVAFPESTGVVDGQGRPCSLRFRLYFLCECGTHTMTRNCNRVHEVHLANHPGYDIDRQDEFIDRYGSYLLTMMYMIKYGAKAGGLAVPPLLGFGLTNDVSIGQEHLQFIRENADRLVDDTISHIEKAIGAVRKGGNAIAYHGLDNLDLTQLRSYLKVKDGKRSLGDLWPYNTQEGYCSWICSHHLCVNSGPAVQRLKHALIERGGVCDNDKVQLKIMFDRKQLYDVIANACRVQSIEDWQSLTNVSLELGRHSSAMKSTSDTISRLNRLESLSLDFGRLSMTANGINRGVLSNVALEVARLSDLRLDDVDFIQQCRPTLLKVLHTPRKVDEARLVNILEPITKLRNLHVGCVRERSFAIINLILSIRENSLQHGGQFTLRTLEVMGERLVPFKQDDPCGCHQYLGSVTTSFPEGSLLEMHINLDERQLGSDDTAVCDFLRRYGWAIKTLGVPCSFRDRHAELLDQATQERGSAIEHLDIIPTLLTETGLNAMDRFIKRSLGFVTVRLSLYNLHDENRLKKAMLLLGRYKGQVKSLRLQGYDRGNWLTRLAETFPARDDFPELEALCGVLSDAPSDVLLDIIIIPFPALYFSKLMATALTSRPSGKFCRLSGRNEGDKGLLQQWADL